MPQKVLRLGFIGLNCTQLAESSDYYTRVLGLHPIMANGQSAQFGCGFGSHALSLHAAEAAGVRHLGLQIADSGSLEGAAAALRSDGIDCKLVDQPAYGIDRAIEIADPDGYRLYLYSDEPTAAAFYSDRGIRPQKLGHVALWAQDARRSEGFYTSTLGFRTSDWIESAFVFLRCNTDHHTLNFLNAPQPGLFHLAFELRDAGHLIEACDALGKEHIPLAWGPGRHGPGHNLYTYHRDPDGNVVELFAELDMMSSEELGYFDPRPHHRDAPQRPKRWAFSRDVDIWGAPPPPEFTVPPGT